MRFLENCPRDALGNNIIHMSVSFLHPARGLEMLNSYVAATFLSGQYNETNFTTHLDERDLHTILREFKLHPLPYIQRAMIWLVTARHRRGVVPEVNYFVE
jgi:hypothetical protein